MAWLLMVSIARSTLEKHAQAMAMIRPIMDAASTTIVAASTIACLGLGFLKRFKCPETGEGLSMGTAINTKRLSTIPAGASGSCHSDAKHFQLFGCCVAMFLDLRESIQKSSNERRGFFHLRWLIVVATDFGLAIACIDVGM